MASTHICPKCGNRKFLTTAHVMQEWEVDEDGEFISCADECLQVSFGPDDDNIWRCSECEDGEGVIVPDHLLKKMNVLSSAFNMLQTATLEEVKKKLALNKASVDWIKKVIT